MFEIGRADLLAAERERAITEAIRTNQLLKSAARSESPDDVRPSGGSRFGGINRSSTPAVAGQR